MIRHENRLLAELFGRLDVEVEHATLQVASFARILWELSIDNGHVEERDVRQGRWRWWCRRFLGCHCSNTFVPWQTQRHSLRDGTNLKTQIIKSDST
jgi:hypothetical protein